jgi:hypothetical protein
LQAGWAVGWIEGISRESAGFGLASEATAGSSQRAAEPALALAASNTTLGSGPNPAVFGATVTLTATVSPSAATGNVTFYDGTTVLGVRNLAGGTATLATSLLQAGSRSLRAYYGGDAAYLASTSSSVTQAVNAQAANSFLAAVNYGAGSLPTSVAVGDFNGDGIADLAVGNINGSNVSVLLGNGNGTFQTAVDYSAGTSPSSVAVGDFNGDGKADLVVTSSDFNSVSMLLGNGDGTFQAPVNLGVGQNRTSAVVGDFNGDGIADLAATNFYDNNVSVLLGNGNGTFRPAVNFAAGTGPGFLSVGDFNGDGKADLAVANWSSVIAGSVSVLLGNGNGTFQAAVNYAAGSGPISLTLGDFNGDGKADLAVADYSNNTVSVLLGT